MFEEGQAGMEMICHENTIHLNIEPVILSAHGGGISTTECASYQLGYCTHGNRANIGR